MAEINGDGTLTETAVEFTRGGLTLRGILHRPDTTKDRRHAVIFVNAGFQYRVGPFRIYVRTARALCAEGFCCLRFDFSGIGNSEGQMKDLHYDTFDWSETTAALDFVGAETGIRTYSIIGLCAGARNAVKTAAADGRIRSVVAISLPVTVFTADSPTARFLTKQDAQALPLSSDASRYEMRSVLPNLVDPHAWRRFLTLQSDYAYHFSVVKRFVLTHLRRTVTPPSVMPACRALIDSTRPVLFVYGEHDRVLIQDFNDTVGSDTARRGPDGGLPYEFSVVDGGDHTFSSVAAQHALIDRIVSYLATTHPVAATPFRPRCRSADSSRPSGDERAPRDTI